MDYEIFLRNRIVQLCKSHNISEHKLSKELGHSKNYIQGITSGRSLPSLSEFLYICEYFNLTPKEFFDTETQYPLLIQKALEGMNKLNDNDLINLIYTINRFNK